MSNGYAVNEWVLIIAKSTVYSRHLIYDHKEASFQTLCKTYNVTFCNEKSHISDVMYPECVKILHS